MVMIIIIEFIYHILLMILLFDIPIYLFKPKGRRKTILPYNIWHSTSSDTVSNGKSMMFQSWSFWKAEQGDKQRQ